MCLTNRKVLTAIIRDHFKRETFCDLFLDNREYESMMCLQRTTHARQKRKFFFERIGHWGVPNMKRCMRN